MDARNGIPIGTGARISCIPLETEKRTKCPNMASHRKEVILAPPCAGLRFLCPQKQCLSGKVDRLLGRTNQRLPPGGSSRRSRVRESALRYNQYKSKVARAPSVTLRSEPPKLISFASGNPCRVPPSSRRKAMLPPDSTPERCNTLYLAEQGVRKGVRTKMSVLLL